MKIIRKLLMIFLAFLVIFPNTLIAISTLNPVKADGPVPGNDCGNFRWPTSYFAGYECFIRGIYNPHSGTDPFSGCSYTNRITYSSGAFWNFCDTAHLYLTGREVIIKVRFINNRNFIILEFVDYQVYNVTPLQPNLINPQSNWDLGPRTNGSFTGVTCDTTGSGSGCSVNFNVDINDPDDTPPVNSTFEIQNITTGANQNTNRTGEGNQTFGKTLTDGNWQWRGVTTDKYNASSGFTSYHTNIRVDTTSPTQPEVNTLQSYSPGTQLNIGSTSITDNFIGGLEYEFQKADDTDFTTNLVTSGWISATNFTFASLSDGSTYQYRVRARDGLWNTTNWSTVTSSTQDAINPVITNLSLNNQKISPQNQDGTKDDSTIQFDWTETNPKESRIQILDLSNNVIRQYIEDTSTSIPDSGHSTWTWDGKSSSNVFVADATYNVKVIVTDQAGQQTVDNSQFIIIDNTPATLNINQLTGAWYNQSTLGITGQTENNALLKITNTTTSEVQNITPNSTTGLFGISPEPLINFGLNLGENTFEFEVNDLVGNVKTDTYKYYREEVAPTLTITSLGSITKNTQPTISLNLTDTGYNNGTNNYISGIDQSSVYIEIKHQDQAAQVLVNNGANVASTLGTINSNCNTAGTFGLSGSPNCTFNFVFNNDLAPDGNYTITARVKDKAGNQSSNATSSFELDSHTQNNVTLPTNGSLFNYSLIQLKGTGEKGSTILITVPDVNGDSTTDTVTFVINEASTGGRVTVNNCRATAAPSTDGIKEICDWTVDNFQLEKNQINNVNVSNPISFKVTDSAGNIDTQVRTVNVNVHAVTLTIGSDLQFISPNGDGKQDGLNFINLSTTGVLGSWKIEIKDSSNNVVKEFTGNVNLPTNVPWDGRDNSGNYLTDGNYTFTLSVTTTDNVTFTTTPQNIQAVTSLTNQVIITYPGNDVFTNQGVQVVQGIAPVETKVRICIDVIGMNASCDYEVNDVAVNSNGTFSVLVPIFRINGQSSTQNFISAFAGDKYGNTSAQSNKVKVTLTTNTPFQSVEIVPAYVGINSSSDYQAILDKLNNNQPLTASDIQSIKYTNFRSIVHQGAERVKLSFADYTNLSDFPSTIQYNNIGYVTGDGAIHLNETFTDGSTAYNQCNQTTCQWDFLYPIPPVPGGLYEIKFDGKLGTTIQTLTAALVLDGNMPASPLILDIDKKIGSDQLNTNLFQNKYYSNSQTVVIRGVSDGNAAISVKDQNNNTICTTTSSSIGFWSCEVTLGYSAPSDTYTLSVQATLGANTATSLKETTLIVDKENPQFTSLTTSHGLTNEAWYRSGDIVDTTLNTNEMLSYAINIDRANSSLNCISATTEDNNQLIQQGAVTDFNVNTTNYTQAGGAYTIPGTAVEGRYCTQIEIQDIAGNRSKEDMILLIDNTTPNIPTIEKEAWGLFDGINTQPQFISKGRLNPEYVHEESSVLIYGYAEESQIVEYFVDGTKRGEITVASRNTFGVTNCKITLDGNLQPLTSDDIKDTVTVQSQYQCLYSFNFAFDQGEKGYTFQVRTKDLAGNVTQVSEDEVIYYDKTAPRLPETFSVAKKDNQTVNDWIYARNQDVVASKYGIGNFGSLPVTNSKDIKVIDYAEALSDMKYTAVDKNGNTYSQFVKQKDGSGFDTREYALAAGDGVYTFYAQSWDAPGNVSGVHLFQLELDTVTPNAPQVSGGMNGLYNIAMSISGEPGSTSVLGKLSKKGSISGTIKTLDINNDSDWNTTLTFCSSLTDRAGNRSTGRCFSVKTPIRPVRPGECDLTAEKEETFKKIATGEIAYNPSKDNLYDLVGYSKSCQTYQPKEIQGSIQGVQTTLIQENSKKDSFNKCLGNNFGNKCNYGDCNVSSATNSLISQCKAETGANLTQEEQQKVSDYLSQTYNDNYNLGGKKNKEVQENLDPWNMVKGGWDALWSGDLTQYVHDRTEDAKVLAQMTAGWMDDQLNFLDPIKLDIHNALVDFSNLAGQRAEDWKVIAEENKGTPLGWLGDFYTNVNFGAGLQTIAGWTDKAVDKPLLSATHLANNFIVTPLAGLLELQTIQLDFANPMRSIRLMEEYSEKTRLEGKDFNVWDAMKYGTDQNLKLITETDIGAGALAVVNGLAIAVNAVPGIGQVISGTIFTIEGVVGLAVSGNNILETFKDCTTSDNPFECGQHNSYGLTTNTTGGALSALAIVGGLSNINKGLGNINKANVKGLEIPGETCVGDACINPGLCFASGTLIQTKHGEVKIEDIKVGDEVLSKDPNTGEQKYKKVVNTFRNHTEYIQKITIGTQVIEATPEHWFFAKEKGWVTAAQLTTETILLDKDNKDIKIDNVESVYAPQEVFNFEVEDYHTYYVSNLGIWVHNDCPTVAQQLEAATKGFKAGDFKCVECVKAIGKVLEANKEPYQIVKLENVRGTRDPNVLKGQVTLNGDHYGVIYKGKFYDNNFPKGFPVNNLTEVANLFTTGIPSVPVTVNIINNL